MAVELLKMNDLVCIFSLKIEAAQANQSISGAI